MLCVHRVKDLVLGHELTEEAVKDLCQALDAAQFAEKTRLESGGNQ